MNHASLKHPGRWIWLFLLVPAVLGLSRLRLDVEIFNLLPGDLPSVQGLRIHQEYFANARELIVTVQAPDPEQTEAAAGEIASALRLQTNLVRRVIWQPPWLEQPGLSAELIAYLWLNQKGDAFQRLADQLAPVNLTNLLADARRRLATSLSPDDIGRLSFDPLGLTRLPPESMSSAPSFSEGGEGFSSANGTLRLIYVLARQELKTYEECQSWLGAVRQIIQQSVAADPRLQVGYTGRPAFVAEIAENMQRDITVSVGGTAVLIAVLFWLAHRRIKPMLWLLALLALVLGTTLALGGLIFGALNVLSLGFAAILLGLAVDYAVVHYQEALAHPRLTVPQIRHAIAPSILWAAVTTICAFLSLNLGGLPGLAQLGTLVAVGVALAAVIMIFEYLPPLFPERSGRNAGQAPSEAVTSTPGQPETRGPLREPAKVEPNQSPDRFRLSLGFVFLLFAVAVVAGLGFPKVDPTAAPLRPRNSAAFEQMRRVQQVLGQEREPLWLIVEGRSEEEVGQRLAAAQPVLARLATDRQIAGSLLPTALWPDPSAQSSNLATGKLLASRRLDFHRAAAAAGFSRDSLALAEGILNTWEQATRQELPFWPANTMSEWLLEKVSARSSAGLYALGLITPLENPPPGWKERLAASLQAEGLRLSGWELLGDSIFQRVKSRWWMMMAPMTLLVLASLWAAFRNLRDPLLSVGVLASSLLCLTALMRLAGWEWNLLNLMAVPLILGTGVDYSIFTLLALRRFGGDSHLAFQSVGRALLLCGGTAIVGFGALGFSSNAGMASLGQVCGAGIALNMVIAVYLLPAWWLSVQANPHRGSHAAPERPSRLYNAVFWRVGLALAKVLPRWLCILLSRPVVVLYSMLAVQRRRVLMSNLLPVVGTRAEARRAMARLYRNFAVKITDLLRYEAEADTTPLLGETTGWEHFQQARAEGRGVLAITPHLGNWEFGAPFLAREGVDLQVITLAEPDARFTALRQQARTRRQVQTMVIGADPFAFVEVIRRLEQGAVVALLVDRPPPPTAVEVTLFGHPFAASIAPAELARASGCLLLPVYVPYCQGRYHARVLPPIDYDRPMLRDRAARIALTQKILAAFEPVIREYPDQWYHFVPVFKRDSG